MKVIVNEQTVLSVDTSEQSETASRWKPGVMLQVHQFSLVVRRKSDSDLVRDTLLEKLATVEGDARKYLVSRVHMNRSRFTNNDFVDAEFEITLTEEDVKPVFSQARINGSLFNVVRYEVDTNTEATVHHLLIEGGKEEFAALEQIVNRRETVDLQRVDVDTEPFACRIGGANYWSPEGGDDSSAFVRIVNCVIDHQPPQEPTFTSPVRAVNLEAKVAVLSLQVQYLLDRLKGVLTEADLAVLGSADKLAEVNAAGADRFWTGLERTHDARRHF
jgi:hypothetical protein